MDFKQRTIQEITGKSLLFAGPKSRHKLGAEFTAENCLEIEKTRLLQRSFLRA